MLGPRPAFQRGDRTPSRGPETLGRTPLSYPFKGKDGYPDRVGAPVFCGHALGADAPNHDMFRSYVFAARRPVKRAGGDGRAIQLAPPAAEQ